MIKISTDFQLYDVFDVLTFSAFMERTIWDLNDKGYIAVSPKGNISEPSLGYKVTCPLHTGDSHYGVTVTSINLHMDFFMPVVLDIMKATNRPVTLTVTEFDSTPEPVPCEIKAAPVRDPISEYEMPVKAVKTVKYTRPQAKSHRLSE
jgi:hypothetical protein